MKICGKRESATSRDRWHNKDAQSAAADYIKNIAAFRESFRKHNVRDKNNCRPHKIFSKNLKFV